ncbi:MAG: c-type cytochrome [Planctomycetes bacterium]|nr:c-type cytochrome [Planctomycetota bacterium]
MREIPTYLATALPRWVALLSLALSGCGSDAPTEQQSSDSSVGGNAVHVDVEARRPASMLSEYNLFADLKNQVPNEGVIPYVLRSSHFVDYAVSHHYLYLPAGARATYHENDVFAFPVGTVLIQSLGFPNDLRYPLQGEHIVETRLLIHQRKGWVAVPYLWNDEGTDARRAVIGGKTTVHWIHHDGEERSHQFITPDMNQCKRCHKNQDIVRPIGVRARNLNCQLADGNQLARWAETGLLDGVPDASSEIPQAVVWSDPTTGSVEERARAWLDVNCSHCHNPHGTASVSGLDLSLHQKMPVRFGVYKPPVAAGRGSSGFQFSITPGSPQTSFLLHRIRSTDPGAMMPTVGRSLVDEEGTALIEQWINEMHGDEQLAERALNPVKAYRAALEGGDASRGKKLFYSTAKCSSCHQANQNDPGNVGPSLADVASRTKREYLLESIVAPSAKIVEKYAATIVELDDGKVHSGIVASEDANELVLRMADATQIKLSKESIDDRLLSPVSLMPSMANILSTQDVADLIEFLSTLKD